MSKKIYSIIVDETDGTPYLYKDSFSTWEEAEAKVISLAKEYMAEFSNPDGNIHYADADMCVYSGEFPLMDYHIEATNLPED